MAKAFGSMEAHKTNTSGQPAVQVGKKQKRTLIVGASPNPSRYAYKAAHLLKEHHHPIIPIGIKKGEVAGVRILNIREKPRIDHIHTITLYIGPRHHPEWMEYLISLKPKRIIFNPGTENKTFEKQAHDAGIEVMEACTLVLLYRGQY